MDVLTASARSLSWREQIDEAHESMQERLSWLLAYEDGPEEFI